MNEYLDPTYSMEDLWSELKYRRKEVADLQADLLALGACQDGDMIETDGERSFPVSNIFRLLEENLALAEHYIDRIGHAIWQRMFEAGFYSTGRVSIR